MESTEMFRGAEAIPIRIDEAKINKVEHFTVVFGIRSISVDLMCCARFTMAPIFLNIVVKIQVSHIQVENGNQRSSRID